MHNESPKNAASNNTPSVHARLSTQTKAVLVTGGAGFIGTHLCQQLRDRDYKVVVLDLKQPTTAVDGVHYVQGDVRHRDLLQTILEKHFVEVVYHLAATVSVPVCQQDPVESYSNNFLATLTVIETIRSLNEKRPANAPIAVAFASTAALYGHKGQNGIAIKESDTATEFLSFYAAQKHASEQAIALFHDNYKMPAMVFRFFNVFGPGQDPKSPYSGVITIFAEKIKKGDALPLNAGGYQTRDFVSVYDLTRALASALDVPAQQWDAKPINLGSGKTVTVAELAKLMAKLSNREVNLLTAPAREGDVIYSLADISRAKKILGYDSTVSLDNGLKELI